MSEESAAECGQGVSQSPEETERRVVARETVELTIEIREGDIYEYWAKTDEYPHFHASNTGLEAIRRVLTNDPRFGVDGRGLLVITGANTRTDQGGEGGGE